MASITVEVDLADFSTDELIRELGDGYVVIDRSSSTNALESMYRALTLAMKRPRLSCCVIFWPIPSDGCFNTKEIQEPNHDH